MGEIPIRDIKPLIEIPDYSYALLLVVICLSAILVMLIIYKVVLYFKNKKESVEKRAFLILKNLTFENPKEFAYSFTKHGKIVAKEQRQKEIFAQLVDKLNDYKYKKVVNELNDDVKNYYNLFMDMTSHEYK